MEKAMQDSDLPVELCSPFSEPDLAGGENRVHYPSLPRYLARTLCTYVLCVFVYFYTVKV